MIIGSPAPPVNATITGTVVNNQLATPAPITANTFLSGAPGTDSLTAGFTAGDSITVDGTTITFVTSGATGNQLNVTDNVGALLNKIQNLTGSTATVSGTGQITLGTGTTQNLNIAARYGQRYGRPHGARLRRTADHAGDGRPAPMSARVSLPPTT